MPRCLVQQLDHNHQLILKLMNPDSISCTKKEKIAENEHYSSIFQFKNFSNTKTAIISSYLLQSYSPTQLQKVLIFNLYHKYPKKILPRCIKPNNHQCTLNLYFLYNQRSYQTEFCLLHLSITTALR